MVQLCGGRHYICRYLLHCYFSIVGQTPELAAVLLADITMFLSLGNIYTKKMLKKEMQMHSRLVGDPLVGDESC